jgi:hypothetical protein
VDVEDKWMIRIRKLLSTAEFLQTAVRGAALTALKGFIESEASFVGTELRRRGTNAASD